MKEILVHNSYGSFNISIKCAIEFLKRKFELIVTSVDERGYVYVRDIEFDVYSDFEQYREDPMLIDIVREFGEYDEYNNAYDELLIETYDDENYSYRIDEYEGLETLVLEPLIREDKIKELHYDFDKLMEYIKSTGVTVK